MTEILHFDTYLDNATYFKNSPYDTIFKLSNPVKCIHKIYLKSLEMPIVFENIRDGNTSNVFSIKINNTIKTATLASKNYTDINVLLTDINNALEAYFDPQECLWREKDQEPTSIEDFVEMMQEESPEIANKMLDQKHLWKAIFNYF